MFEKYDAYKDSGVEWIGNIPAKWSLKKISHIFRNIGSGTTPLSGSDIYYKNGYINWLQTGDLNDGYIDETSKKITEKALRHYSTLKQYPKGSLVVAMYGATIGKVGILNIDTATNQACCVLGANLGVNIKYYFYMFQGFKADIIRMAYGGGQPNISQDTIKKLRLPFPDLSTQHEISKFLDQKTTEIDQAIAIKEQQIALLNERKQIVIQKAVTQGLDPNVPMKDSGVEWIGQMPEHWDIERLGTMLEPVSKKGNLDKSLLSITREKGVILRDVEDDSENHNFIPDDLSNYKLIEKGQFGMNKMKAWQGSYGVSPYTGIVSPAYYVFKFIKPIHPEFFHWAIRSKLYVSFFGSASDGVRIGQWDLSKDRMKKIPFIYPSLAEQEKIVEYLEIQMSLIAKGIQLYTVEIIKLKEYKTTLINDAVTGKIKVA
ncbi:restriction endonuclease subunit S [Acinetobacter towneri]|uniref:restriction endonuclease subunit S n=1 Tax=Acinetobacter towneri TaxID=202956 RepID=UPI001CE0AEA4|nr:restriction endonuclease subunit S [Acinetobacter towneri]MCA4780320.1 restriction endonuclease subunit S [Acinetobacter towneri]MCA4785712.1 restriction endonuclease subunit S [Acinetobacter towneri]MCA4786955.1 restriction endonuclease subunit S [Acinetobacter towneri]MCA4796847.1 restriction endonuclease subunit S [Acinetobacter towneri]MCA4801894.1 restriction endonuclease subunit S [Acinetobacter towneri]